MLQSWCHLDALCCGWKEHNGKRNDEMLLQFLATCIGWAPEAKLLQHWSKTNSLHKKIILVTPLQQHLLLAETSVPFRRVQAYSWVERVSVLPLHRVHGATLAHRIWHLTHYCYTDRPSSYFPFVLCEIAYSGYQNLIARDFLLSEWS